MAEHEVKRVAPVDRVAVVATAGQVVVQERPDRALLEAQHQQ
jgi:hypothetical protein